MVCAIPIQWRKTMLAVTLAITFSTLLCLVTYIYLDHKRKIEWQKRQPVECQFIPYEGTFEPVVTNYRQQRVILDMEID